MMAGDEAQRFVRGLHSLCLLIRDGNYFMRMVLCVVQLLRSDLVIIRGPPPADVTDKRDAFIDMFFPTPIASRKGKGTRKR